jgi:hypothetical protein
VLETMALKLSSVDIGVGDGLGDGVGFWNGIKGMQAATDPDIRTTAAPRATR